MLIFPTSARAKERTTDKLAGVGREINSTLTYIFKAKQTLAPYTDKKTKFFASLQKINFLVVSRINIQKVSNQDRFT